jgi:hypothetical protein
MKTGWTFHSPVTFPGWSLLGFSDGLNKLPTGRNSTPEKGLETIGLPEYWWSNHDAPPFWGFSHLLFDESSINSPGSLKNIHLFCCFWLFWCFNQLNVHLTPEAATFSQFSIFISSKNNAENTTNWSQRRATWHRSRHWDVKPRLLWRPALAEPAGDRTHCPRFHNGNLEDWSVSSWWGDSVSVYTPRMSRYEYMIIYIYVYIYNIYVYIYMHHICIYDICI